MVHHMFRRSVTAGIAFAGAGAIAFSTLPVLPSDEVVAVPRAAAFVQPGSVPPVVMTEVELASLVQTLQILVDGAAGTLRQTFVAFTTQIPALVDYVGIGVEGGPWADPDLLPWNHSLLLGNTLLAPIAPLFVGAFTDAVIDVVATSNPAREDEIRESLTESVDYAFARLIGPIVSALGATGAAHQEYYRAGMEGNPPGQWLALLRAPMYMLDGFFNGGYGDISPLLTGMIGGPRIAAPGLFTPWGEYPEDRTVSDVFPDVESDESTSAEGDATVARVAVVTDQDAAVTGVVDNDDDTAESAGAEDLTEITKSDETGRVADAAVDTADTVETAEDEKTRTVDVGADRDVENGDPSDEADDTTDTKADKDAGTDKDSAGNEDSE